MTVFSMMLLLLGVILLGLSLFSGIGLYRKAMGTNINDNNSSMGTLWLLFLVGLVVGLLFIWLALNSIVGISWVVWVFITIIVIMGIMALIG